MTDTAAAADRPLSRWQFPELARPGASAPLLGASADEMAGEPSPTAEPETPACDEPSLDEIVREEMAKGYSEGWERGFADGGAKGYLEGFETASKAAEAALMGQAQSLVAILERLSAPIPVLDAVVEEAVAGLALEVARCVIRIETSRSREYLVQLIREAIAKVPIEMGTLKLVLNPTDVEVIRRLAPEIENGSALLVSDGAIEPGDCVVVADGQAGPIKDMRWRPRAGEGMSQVDLSLATRWRAVMLALFEDEDK